MAEAVKIGEWPPYLYVVFYNVSPFKRLNIMPACLIGGPEAENQASALQYVPGAKRCQRGYSGVQNSQ